MAVTTINYVIYKPTAIYRLPEITTVIIWIYYKYAIMIYVIYRPTASTKTLWIYYRCATMVYGIFRPTASYGFRGNVTWFADVYISNNSAMIPDPSPRTKNAVTQASLL